MQIEQHIKMLEKVSDDLNNAVDDLHKMNEDELVSLLNGLKSFNQSVDYIIGQDDDDFDLDKAEALLNEMELFFSNDSDQEFNVKNFEDLGKSLQLIKSDADNEFVN